jgi:hypothetical protein
MNYEEKKQTRINRYRELSEKAKAEAQVQCDRADEMLSWVPPGQPILVGHHSEKRHRNLLDKVDSAYRKSVEANEKSKYYEKKANNAEDNAAISSDDPKALEKLNQTLTRLEEIQKRMVELNAYYRKNKTCKGFGKYTDEQAAEMDAKIQDQTQPCPSYALQNNLQNIKRIKSRIAELEKRDSTDYQGWEFEDGIVTIDKEDNRIRIVYNTIPSEEKRQELKKSGWHWSRYNKAWQRQLTDNAIYAAKRVTRK